MNLELGGDAALIVGGASGIGLAIARAFAREGARSVLADRSPAVAERAAEIAQEYGQPCWGLVCDVTDAAAVASTVAAACAQCGAIDHLVYAAGAGSGQFGFPFWNVGRETWGPVLATNLLGAVSFAHLLGPQMAERRRGTLTFLSSVAGQIGSPTDPPYSAAKAALINFMQVVAKDLAPFGVRANALAPGMVQTPLNQNVWRAWNDRQPPGGGQPYEAWAAEKIQKLIPLNRWQTPEDIAAAAVFLASPRAQNITGQTWNIDGGWVMHS